MTRTELAAQILTTLLQQVSLNGTSINLITTDAVALTDSLLTKLSSASEEWWSCQEAQPPADVLVIAYLYDPVACTGGAVVARYYARWQQWSDANSGQTIKPTHWHHMVAPPEGMPVPTHNKNPFANPPAITDK